MRIKEFIKKHKKDIIVGATGVVVGSVGMLVLRKNTIPKGVKVVLISQEVGKKLNDAKIAFNPKLHVITATAEHLQMLIDDVAKTDMMDVGSITFTKIK